MLEQGHYRSQIMGAMQSQPMREPSPLAREAQKIKAKVDNVLAKMLKEPNFMPTREMLGEFAQEIIYFASRNHEKTMKHESYLKAAIIDLTEVPEMSPQMQRIAFQTCLKDASKELSTYISCC